MRCLRWTAVCPRALLGVAAHRRRALRARGRAARRAPRAVRRLRCIRHRRSGVDGGPPRRAARLARTGLGLAAGLAASRLRRDRRRGGRGRRRAARWFRRRLSRHRSRLVPLAAGSISVVSNAETPDQLRRLRRTALLNARPLPREISAEPRPRKSRRASRVGRAASGSAGRRPRRGRSRTRVPVRSSTGRSCRGSRSGRRRSSRTEAVSGGPTARGCSSRRPDCRQAPTAHR